MKVKIGGTNSNFKPRGKEKEPVRWDPPKEGQNTPTPKERK